MYRKFPYESRDCVMKILGCLSLFMSIHIILMRTNDRLLEQLSVHYSLLIEIAIRTIGITLFA
jgi:hypothetical protein